MISCMIASLTAERFRIAQVPFVKLDVFFREIARVKYAIVPASIQENVEIEFRLADDRAERLQSDACRLAAPDREDDLAFAWPAVADIDFRFVHLRFRITDRAQNPSPIRIAAEPARFHQ